jgi:hypothetical protein
MAVVAPVMLRLRSRSSAAISDTAAFLAAASSIHAFIFASAAACLGFVV